MKNALFALLLILIIACSPQQDVLTSSSTLSGSYATMLPINGFLYVINESDIITYDISDNQNPILIDQQSVGFEIESLFHNDGVLFIGSSESMHIYIISENGIPEEKSNTIYNFEASDTWTSCDPIVADDQYAYATLRSQNIIEEGCFTIIREVNELRVYNIEDLENPDLISITPLDFPKGLALTGDHLFICEGNEGIKLFDVSNKEEPIEVWADLGFESFDVILKEGIMMVVGPESLRQYDYSDLNNITFLNAITY